MKTKILITASFLLFDCFASCAIAGTEQEAEWVRQVTSPAKTQAHSTWDLPEADTPQYDRYGKITSVYQRCREAQMAGGPITETCAWKRYRFDQQGNLLVFYRFDHWGYGVIENLPEKVARQLDADSTYRTKYIKQHGYEKYKIAATPKAELTDKDVNRTTQLAEHAYEHQVEYRLDETHHYVMRCNRYLPMPAANQQEIREREIQLSMKGQSNLVNKGECSVWDGEETKFRMTIDETLGDMIKATLQYPDDKNLHTVGYFFRADLIPVPSRKDDEL
jgi:hypothetical protein